MLQMYVVSIGFLEPKLFSVCHCISFWSQWGANIFVRKMISCSSMQTSLVIITIKCKVSFESLPKITFHIFILFFGGCGSALNGHGKGKK